MDALPKEELQLPTAEEMHEFNKRALRSWGSRFRWQGKAVAKAVAPQLLAEVFMWGCVAFTAWLSYFLWIR